MLNLSTLQKLAALPCPVVGSSVPGGKPWAFERRRLALLIEGLDHARVRLLPPGQIVKDSSDRWGTQHTLTTSMLSISNERRSYRLVGHDMAGRWRWNDPLRRIQGHWAKSQRQANGKLHPDECQEVEPCEPASLRKLRRQLRSAGRRLSQPCRPPMAIEWPDDYRCEHERPEWLRWYAQKATRRKLGQLVFAVKPSSRAACYKRLQGAGFVVKKWHKLTKVQQRYFLNQNGGYLEHIYAAMGMQTKPYGLQPERWSHQYDSRTLRDERLAYCHSMRQYRNDVERIEWLKSQIASYRKEFQRG